MRYFILPLFCLFLLSCKAQKEAIDSTKIQINEKGTAFEDTLYTNKSDESRAVNAMMESKKKDETTIVIYKGKTMLFSEYKKNFKELHKSYEKANVIRGKEKMKKYKVSDKCKVLIVIDWGNQLFHFHLLDLSKRLVE